MEEQTNLIESLLGQVKDYINTSLELIKLKALDKVSEVVASILSSLTAFIFIFVCFLMANIGIALWLGEILGKLSHGFFIVAAFYGIIGVVLNFLMHRWLKKLLVNLFIKKFHK
jgi:Flp pilus assembly protein TadB